MSINKDIAKSVLDSALSGGGEFAELFFESHIKTEVNLDNGEIEDVLSGCVAGVGLRVEDDNTNYFSSSNDISNDGLLNLAKKISKSVGKARKTKFRDFKTRNLPTLSPIKIDPLSVSLETKTALVRSADASAREYDKRISQVRAYYADSNQEVVVANSEGLYDSEKRVRTVLYVQAVASDKDRMFAGLFARSETSGFELFDKYPPKEIGAESARVAALQLDSAPAPAGEMTVVIGASAGGTMIHEACGHGLEGDIVLTGTSVYAGKVGQLVASPLVSVLDDGTLPNYRGTEKMDDEGTPSTKVVLIENGVLKNFLQSRKSARILNMELTGNGRRQSFRHLPIPRMRNTYIASGKTPPEEIIASVKSGLYVAQMGGGQVDTTSGNFVFHVREGYLIKNGKLAEPVRGATLTGCGPEVLKSIDMVGSDLGFAIGTCGKDGQMAPVSDALPTIRIPKIIVGGIK